MISAPAGGIIGAILFVLFWYQKRFNQPEERIGSMVRSDKKREKISISQKEKSGPLVICESIW